MLRPLEHPGRGRQQPFDLIVAIGRLAAKFGIGGHESTAAMLAEDTLSEQADAHPQLPAADGTGLMEMHRGTVVTHGVTLAVTCGSTLMARHVRLPVCRR